MPMPPRIFVSSRTPIFPNNGDHVTTPEGLHGDVQSVNVLRQLVKVVVTLDNDEKEIREYKAAELKFKPRRKKKDMRLSKEEIYILRSVLPCRRFLPAPQALHSRRPHSLLPAGS